MRIQPFSKNMAETDKTKLLTPQQLRFCQRFIESDNATEACIAAGYSEKSAASQASRLLKNANVTVEITRRQEAAGKRAEIREDDIIRMLLDDRDGARAVKQYGPAVRAAELLGRKLGMFVDKRLVGEIREHTDEEIAAGLAKATAGKDPVLARVLFRNALAGIPPNSFDPRPELSDEQIDALISGDTVH